MKNKIYFLLDYKGQFGSKYFANPYRSGMDLNLLSKYCISRNMEPIFLRSYQLDFCNQNYEKCVFLYTSQEDAGRFYKNFLEDIVLGLKSAGAILIPKYEYMIAHENKVFMEIYAKTMGIKDRPKSYVIGCREELFEILETLSTPIVVKNAQGAMSEGVYLARTKNELLGIVEKITRTSNFYYNLKDYLRQYKYNGYYRESRNRRKLVLQEFIPNLGGDWKVLVFGNKYYILNRKTRKNDFRASGSGNFTFTKDIPTGILEFASTIFNQLMVPNVSLDIAFDGESYFLIEYQAVYFGTTTLEKSSFYFLKNPTSFICVDEKSILEEIYLESIFNYLER